MDRAVLLALLGIPVLIILHIALSGQPLPLGVPMISSAFACGVQKHPCLQGHWQPAEAVIPTHYVAARMAERGS